MSKPDQPMLDKKLAVAKLWNMGILHWKLDPVQKELYNSVQNAKFKTIVWSCSRRLGKSYALCCVAVEKCLQKPNVIVKFIAPSQKHVKMIIRPLLKEIFKDCPDTLRPDFRTADNIYRFQNGSEIQLAGTDQGHAENLRGGSADLCIVDEAGFCDDLRYIIQSILIPTTTTTRGKIILSSTPPKSADHPFVKYMEEAEEKGNFVKKTIYDGIGSRITQDMIDEIVAELGGVNSPDFRREYMCELCKDEETTVVPEFNETTCLDIVKDWKLPPYYDAYVSGDLGAKDFTVFLFGYYDFRAGKLIVEDEVVLKGGMIRVTTDLMAKEIKKTEERLWMHPITKEVKPPYMRVCDNDLLVINNLQEQNKLTFFPTAKHDATGALNNMRVMLKEGRIIIHPRCKTLIQHLKYATWAKNKKSYDRDSANGHYDAIDALKYMVRNVQQQKNPYPASFGITKGDIWWDSLARRDEAKVQMEQKSLEKLKDLFKVKPNIRFNPRK